MSDIYKYNIHNAGVGGSSPPITTTYNKVFRGLKISEFSNVLHMCYNWIKQNPPVNPISR